MSKGMVKNIDKLLLEKSWARNGVLLQLFLTHGITSALALASVFGLTHLKIMSLPMSIIGAIVACGGLGLLLTANIPYLMYFVERTVIAISQGQAVTFPTFSWPFTQLFTHLRTLDRRVQIYIQGERAAAEIRRRSLQQASENATQTERQRIARDLHDSIKQQLFSISVSAAAVKAYLSKDILKAQAAITDIQRVTKEAQVEMQALLQQLGSTPLENTKLADALRTQAEALKYRSGLEMKLTIGDLPADDLLPEGTHETIFRLVQEAFANIARHARAKAVIVTLQQTERALHLIVSDNGKGFNTSGARTGMGLTNMRERVAALNGTIEVQSAPEQGTTLHIVIPFLQPQRSVEEIAHSERELKQVLERARNGFLVGRTAQSIVMLFIVSNISNLLAIQIPIAAIIICMLITGYGFWQGRSSMMHLISHWGKENVDVLTLRQKEERILGSLLGTLVVGGEYFMNTHQGWNNVYEVSSFIAFLGLLIVLLGALLWRGYHTQGRIYHALPPEEALIEITYQRRNASRSMRVLFALGLSVVLVGAHFVSNQQTSQVGIILLILSFFIGGGIILFNFIVLQMQIRLLGGEQEKVSFISLFRGEQK